MLKLFAILFLLLLIVVLSLNLYIRICNYINGSKCISMRCFKDKNYLDKFNDIYNDIYEKYLLENKEEIDKTRKLIIIRYSILVFTLWNVLSGCVFLMISHVLLGLTLILTSPALFYLSVYLKEYVEKGYAKILEKYKSMVINSYIRKMNQGFGYSLMGCIDKEVFIKSNDFSCSIDHYYGTDYVTGVVEGRRTFNISELYVKYKNIDKNKNKIFCGLFAFFASDRQEQMKISVASGRIKYKNIPLNMQVGIERYIKEFLKKQKVDFKCDVKDGKIYIKVYTGDLLSPSIFSDKKNKNRLWAYYLIIKFIVELTGMMNNVKTF